MAAQPAHPFAVPVLVAVALVAAGGCAPPAGTPGGTEPETVSVVLDTDDPAVREAVADALRRVASAPSDPEARFELGRRLQANGLATDAEAAYLDTLRMQPTHSRAAYLLAVCRHAAGRPEEAVAGLRALSAAGGTDAAMERALAQWSFELGDLAGAGAAAARAVAMAPASHGSRALMARYLLEAGQPEDARAELEKLIAKPVHHAFLDQLYADALSAAGRQAEAEAARPATTPRQPLWPDPHVEALNELAAGLEPALREARELIGSGGAERALEQAEKLHLDHPESVEAAILHVVCLRNVGRLGDAYGVVMAELDRRPRHPALLTHAAAVLVASAQASGSPAQLPAALALAEAAVEADPGRYDAHGVLGATLLWSGRLEEALAAFQRCAAIDPVGPAQCPTKAGNVLIMLGRVDEGLDVLREACDRQPLEPAPNITYAIQLRGAGRTGELDELLSRLRAGGSVAADLLADVERALASGATIDAPELDGATPG